MVEITKSKSYILVRDIGSKVFVARAVIILFFLALTFIFTKHINYISFLALLAVVLSTVLLYLWGGWKTVKSGYSLLDSAKLGFIVGLVVGVFTELVLRKSSIADIIFEAVVGAIFTFIGALITKKFKLANAAR